jgi:UDP-glucose 4-epimerase
VMNVLKMIAEMLGENIELKFEDNPQSGHYDITPYSFSPKIGKKFTSPFHIDLGQGFLRVIDEVHKKLHPELHDLQDALVKEEL